MSVIEVKERVWKCLKKEACWYKGLSFLMRAFWIEAVFYIAVLLQKPWISPQWIIEELIQQVIMYLCSLSRNEISYFIHFFVQSWVQWFINDNGHWRSGVPFQCVLENLFRSNLKPDPPMRCSQILSCYLQKSCVWSFSLKTFTVFNAKN